MNFPIEQVFSLSAAIAYRHNQITSTVLISENNTNIVLYAMDSEESISSESSPNRKMVFVLDGSLNITINQTSYALHIGDSFIIDKNTQHAIEALERCKFVQINYNNKEI